MPLYFLSGAMFPLASMPAWMQTLMVLDPMTYGVDARATSHSRVWSRQR